MANTVAKSVAEAYVGRPLSDAEYTQLINATYAEAGNHPVERAMVAASILNRARDEGSTITNVLLAKNQFQSVTGTPKNGHLPSPNFVQGPGSKDSAAIQDSITTILPSVSHGQNDFTSANLADYGPGTDPRVLTNMQRNGGTVVGTSIFNTAPPSQADIQKVSYQPQQPVQHQQPVQQSPQQQPVPPEPMMREALPRQIQNNQAIIQGALNREGPEAWRLAGQTVKAVNDQETQYGPYGNFAAHGTLYDNPTAVVDISKPPAQPQPIQPTQPTPPTPDQVATAKTTLTNQMQPPLSSAPPAQMYALGSQGQAVQAFQTYLAKAGYNPSNNIDGVYGPVTEDAVTKYQINHRLNPDGVIGPKTLASFYANPDRPPIPVNAPLVNVLPPNHPILTALGLNNNNHSNVIQPRTAPVNFVPMGSAPMGKSASPMM